MGYLKPIAKGLPAWCRGVWLGKTFLNDANVVYCKNGLFITRSVRRIPNPWSLDSLGSVGVTPQYFGHTSVCAQTALHPRVSVPAMVVPKDAQTVQQTPDEAASEPPTPLCQSHHLDWAAGCPHLCEVMHRAYQHMKSQWLTWRRHLQMLLWQHQLPQEVQEFCVM